MSGNGALSLQVLQEFFVVITRKVPRPLSAAKAADVVSDLSLWKLHTPVREDLLAAIELHRRDAISLWDALILQSARRLHCTVVWSEDLQTGRSYAGATVRNPFV